MPAFKITDETTLVVRKCPTCGTRHAIDERIDQTAHEDTSNAVYCPNGHAAYYVKSTSEKLTEEYEKRIAKLQDTAKWHLDNATQHRERADSEARRIASLKGQITKLRRRIAARPAEEG